MFNDDCMDHLQTNIRRQLFDTGDKRLLVTYLNLKSFCGGSSRTGLIADISFNWLVLFLGERFNRVLALRGAVANYRKLTLSEIGAQRSKEIKVNQCYKSYTLHFRVLNCCGASVASEQQHNQDSKRIYRIYKRVYEFSNSSLFTRMHCI